MLRSASTVPANASSPKKEETETTKTSTSAEILFNLDRNSMKEKRSKANANLSSDDDDGNIMSESNRFVDDDESRLEDLVFGGENALLENITKKNVKKQKITSGLKFQQFLDTDSGISQKEIADGFETRKPVWEDDNDDDEKAPEQQANKFMKYYGTPIWADLANKDKRKKSIRKKAKITNLNENQSADDSDSYDEEESDTDDLSANTNFFQQTGNFLADSSRLSSVTSTLPKTNLDIKVCTDANKESPDSARLKCVEFHPNARVMLTAGLNQKLTLFQIDGKKNAKIQSIFIDKFPIMAAHFTKTGDEIILGSRHKSFYYYDMIAGKLISVTPPVKALDEVQRHSIASIFEISPDNRFICFIGSQGQIHLFSSKSKEWINTLKINDQCNAVAFSPDSRYLYAFGDDKDVHVFDMNDRGHRSLYKFTDYGCLSGTSIAVSNNNQFIATGCKSGVVNIYNINESLQADRNPKPLKSFMNLTTPCTSLKFNSTSEILAACSSYAENACKLIHVGSLSVFSNFPQNNLNDTAHTTSGQIRIPQCIDFSMNSGYFTIGNHKGNALLYRLKHYGSF